MEEIGIFIISELKTKCFESETGKWEQYFYKSLEQGLSVQIVGLILSTVTENLVKHDDDLTLVLKVYTGIRIA